MGICERGNEKSAKKLIEQMMHKRTKEGLKDKVLGKVKRGEKKARNWEKLKLKVRQGELKMIRKR